jgi:hypothetical protein
VLGRVLINAAAHVRFQSEVDMISQAKPAGSVENDPHRQKGSRLRCAARFNDDAATWYAVITVCRGEPNETEGIHRPCRECGGATAVANARRARAGTRTHLQNWDIDRRRSSGTTDGRVF